MGIAGLNYARKLAKQKAAEEQSRLRAAFCAPDLEVLEAQVREEIQAKKAESLPPPQATVEVGGFQCPSCSFRSKSAIGLRSHVKSHESGLKYLLKEN